MTVRVTRKVRRVVERLDKGPATALETSVDTNISLSAAYVILDRLLDAGWVIYRSDHTHVLTAHGRACLRDLPPAHGPRIFNSPYRNRARGRS